MNPGFETDHVLTAHLSLGGPSYQKAEQRDAFWRQFEQRVATLPGVEEVGATSELPLSGERSDCPFYIDGQTYEPSQYDDAQCRQVTPGYLSAVRIPLLAGRWLNDHDTATAPGVMLVNQALAERFFDGKEVIGKHVQVMEGKPVPRVIVGLIADIHQSALSGPEEAEMYVPYSQVSPPTMNLVVRTTVDSAAMAGTLRQTIRSVDKELALSPVRSMEEVRNASVAEQRFSSQLLGLFAGLALLLAAVGLYGLMAYTVTQRTREIGIRVALGATHGNILRMTLLRGLQLVLWGTAIGLVAAFALSRVLRDALYGIKATDPLTYVMVSLLLTAVALLACYVPAHRAMRVDPMVALRQE